MDSRPLAQAKLILRQCLHRRYFPIYAFGLLFVLFGINIIHRSGTYNFHPAAFAIANQDHNLVRFFSLPTSHIQLVRETSNIIPLPHTADFATADDLDTWVSTGNYNTTTRFSDIRFDIVYTWVNGSDKQLQRQKAPWEDRSIVFNISAAAREFSVDQEEEDTNFQKWKTLKTDKRYRDFDELRYSVRSIEQYIGDLARQVTILSADFPLESPGDEPDSVTFVPDPDAPNIVRTGQVPQWLHPSILRNHSFTSTTSASRLRFVHHSQIFLPPYHHTHLPTFSSNAIESHLADVPHLLPHFVYMNDDVFFGSPIVASDFWTPLHGFVFHTVRGLLVKPERTVVEVDGKDPAGGEWPALEWSNELLSGRFGRRHRYYIAHYHHMMSAPILNEIRLEWPQALLNTSSHHFRGEGLDVHMPFLFTHYVIERHREALLHSYLALRIDRDADGFWSWDERREVLAVIEKWQQGGKFLAPGRTMMDRWKESLEGAGIEATKLTEYEWTSADGYAFTKTTLNVWGEPVEGEYYDTDWGTKERKCVLDVGSCFPEGFADSEVEKVKADWRKVAFGDVTCGDCLMMMLVAENGETGLEGFLPAKDAPRRDPNPSRPWALMPHTSNTSSPTTSNPTPSFDPSRLVPPNTPSFLNPFSTDPTLTTRERAVARIHRYAYTIGNARVAFVSLKAPAEARRDLQTLLTRQNPANYSSIPEKTPTAFFCLNDDFESHDPRAQRRLRKYVREFLESWFPNRTVHEGWWWERGQAWKQIYKLPGEPGRELSLDEILAVENEENVVKLKPSKGFVMEEEVEEGDEESDEGGVEEEVEEGEEEGVEEGVEGGVEVEVEKDDRVLVVAR